jgi:hypothetical protein
MDLLKIMKQSKLLGFKYYMSVSEWVRERIVKFISQKILLDILYTRFFFFFFFAVGKLMEINAEIKLAACSKWQSSLSIII